MIQNYMAILGWGQPALMRGIFVWIMPQVQNESLDFFIHSCSVLSHIWLLCRGHVEWEACLRLLWMGTPGNRTSRPFNHSEWVWRFYQLGLPSCWPAVQRNTTVLRLHSPPPHPHGPHPYPKHTLSTMQFKHTVAYLVCLTVLHAVPSSLWEQCL